MEKIEKILFWSEYWGELLFDQDARHPMRIFGFENCSPTNKGKENFKIELPGTFWGFAQSGGARFQASGTEWKINAGQWFCLHNKDIAHISLAAESRVFLSYTAEHLGVSSMGGPIEATGRLQYIDGCTDSLLYYPPVKGDPCLNLLHFPEKVDQTSHFHPSSRSGIVYRGKGSCIQRADGHDFKDALLPGNIFYIAKQLRHKFQTLESASMDIISFHPDSDWGPTHETHPMINRTWMKENQTE